MPLRIGIRLAADIPMEVFHGNGLDLVVHHLVTGDPAVPWKVYSDADEHRCSFPSRQE
jgi:hypothetical protein